MIVIKTVKCPQGDNGVCTIPGRTMVVTLDGARMVSREDLLSEYPQLDLGGTDRALVDADPGEVLEVLHAPGHGRERPVTAAIRAAFDRTSGSTSVVVTCTCGHVFVQDTG